MKKKWIKFVLLAAVIAGVAACGVNDTGDLEQTQAPQEAQEPEEVAQLPELPELPDAQEPESTQNSTDAEQPQVTQYIRITPQEAYEMMLTEDVIILDVRFQDEFDEGHIPGAVLLPNPEIRERATNVIPDFDQIILVYCRAGSRSETASRTLIDMGYTRVYDFGGINQWQGEIVN